jgi:[acyl-carrier-protein] S-malonyltransferase
MELDTNGLESANLAYVFPGQGAQYVGMGREIYRTSRAARDIFDEVDEVLGVHLTRMVFEGPEEDLNETINSQPAIMATSLACYGALGELKNSDLPKPTAVAGHSLGEYTSMVVSGVVNLADGIRLVRERGRLMQEASALHPGSMAAIIGLDEETVEEICHETGAEVANINGGDQVVISGDKICVARAVDLASIRGARKAVPLAVSGAFHSSLMSEASRGLSDAVKSTAFREPAVPIIGNSICRPLTTAQDIKDELLNQLCSCVQWQRSVNLMMDIGISNFIEFGPGRVLGGLIKKIGSEPCHKDTHIEIANVGDLASVTKVAEAGYWDPQTNHR